MYLQTYVYVCFANIVSTCLMSTSLFYLIMNNYNNICYFCYKQFSKYLHFNYSYAYWVGKRRVPRSFFNQFNHYYIIYYILIANFRKCCMHIMLFVHLTLRRYMLEWDLSIMLFKYLFKRQSFLLSIISNY